MLTSATMLMLQHDVHDAGGTEYVYFGGQAFVFYSANKHGYFVLGRCEKSASFASVDKAVNGIIHNYTEQPTIPSDAISKTYALETSGTGTAWVEKQGGGGTQLYKHTLMIKDSVAWQQYDIITTTATAFTDLDDTHIVFISGSASGYGPATGAVRGVLTNISCATVGEALTFTILILSPSESSIVLKSYTQADFSSDTVTAL